MKQFYALKDSSSESSTGTEGLALVRLQSPDGSLYANQYGPSDYNTIGPLPSFFRMDECVDKLLSGSKVEVLELLTWCAGYHVPADEYKSPWDSYEPDVFKCREKLAESRILEELAKNEDKWVREVAEEAIAAIRKKKVPHAADK